MNETEYRELNVSMWDKEFAETNAGIKRLLGALELATSQSENGTNGMSFQQRLFHVLWSCLHVHWNNKSLTRENEHLRRELARVVNQAETLQANLSIFVEFCNKEKA